MKRFRNRKYLLWVSASVIGLGGYFWLRAPAPDPTQRIGKAVRESLVQRVTLAGNIEPNRTTTLAAPYEGYIRKLFVHLGQQVQKGAPLVSIVQSLNGDDEAFPIRAPFTGTVVQVLKTEGQQVKPGADKEAILRLDDLSKLYIHANAPEIDIVKVKKGQKTNIRASAILTRSYEGIVREISLAATSREQWGNRSQIEYLVKIEVMNPDALLKSGMSCLIDIVTNEKENVLALPHEFIHLDGENPFVVLKHGEKVPVKLGLQNEMRSEIVEGISEGTEVRQVDFLEASEGT